MEHKEVLSLPLSKILKGDNVRESFSNKEMDELMVSLKQTGQLQPIGVKKLPKGNKYKMIFGYRRLIAAEKLGWTVIDAVEIEARDEKEEIVKETTENTIRVNPSFPQQGRRFQMLVKKGMTVSEIAVAVGCSKQFVQDCLEGYYRIPKDVQKKISTAFTPGNSKKPGTLTPTAAFEVLSIQRKFHMKDVDARKLYDMASQDAVGANHLRVAGALISKGYTAREAVKEAAETRLVTLQFAIDKAHCAALERKHKMKIHDLVYAFLETHGEMSIYPMRSKHNDKVVVVTKKKEAREIENEGQQEL